MAGEMLLTELLMPLVGVLTPREPRQHVRPEDGSDELSGQVDSTPWESWLSGDTRLTDTGTIDACGCAVYHWSGADHTKSVTLHDGCENGYGAHLWSGTMQHDLGIGEHGSRLQLAAALRSCSIAEAAVSVGIVLGPRPLTVITDEDLDARADELTAEGATDLAERFRSAAASYRKSAAERNGQPTQAITGGDDGPRVAGGVPPAPVIEVPGEQEPPETVDDDQSGYTADAEDGDGSGRFHALFTALADPYEQALEDQVFDFIPQTQLIRNKARARRISPWAALGTTILRGLLRVSPNVMLPPIVGSHGAQLNMQLGIVGSSGKGKDTARTVVGYTATVDEGWDSIHMPPSGAALAALYVDWLPDADGKLQRTQIRESAWCDWSEVDTLTATAKRGGNDLASQLRAAISGHRLGTDTKLERKAPITVDANTYRISVSFSVQYGSPAEPLMAERDGGTLQRTIWVGASDPLGPRKRVADPQGQIDLLTHLGHGQPFLGVDSDVFDLIDEARWEYLRRDGDEDARQGHRGLNTLKIAAWAALVQYNPQITMREWRWAEDVMSHSDRIYDRLVASVKGLRRADAKEQGYLDHVRRQATAAAAAAQTETLLSGLAQWGSRRYDKTGQAFTLTDIHHSAKHGDARRERKSELAAELVARGVWECDGGRYWPVQSA